MIREIKPKRIGRFRHVACLFGKRTAYRIVEGSLEG
jgi:hypothetical protein